ncbi:MAG: ester cyclase [Chloroflexi bacterium]|nr:ester cyclase [Chloroflexota bacterium]
MGAQENKAKLRRFIEEGLNKGNMATVDETVAANAVDHALPPGMPQTREGFKMFFTAFRGAFPDLHYHIDEEIAEGDKVVQRATGHGTMKGDFQGMPANGKHGTWTEMHIVRMEGGKVVEHWANVDQMGMLVSLGFMPPPGG